MLLLAISLLHYLENYYKRINKSLIVRLKIRLVCLAGSPFLSDYLQFQFILENTISLHVQMFQTSIDENNG